MCLSRLKPMLMKPSSSLFPPFSCSSLLECRRSSLCTRCNSFRHLFWRCVAYERRSHLSGGGRTHLFSLFHILFQHGMHVVRSFPRCTCPLPSVWFIPFPIQLGAGWNVSLPCLWPWQPIHALVSPWLGLPSTWIYRP